ncbi:MAG: hypothetical protein ACLVH8_04420 [Fusobacterium sp.]
MVQVTVYVVSNPLGICTHVFTAEDDAKRFLIREFAERGEEYTYEPCVMELDKKFLLRLKVLEDMKGIQFFERPEE